MPDKRDLHIDAVLTGISIAFKNPGFVADVVFPLVPVKHESDKYYIYGKERFDIPSALRAPKSAYKRVDWSVSTGTYSCEEYGLEEPIDDRERDNADEPLNLDIDTTEFLTDMLLLNREKRVADKLSDTTVLTQNVTLSGTSQWSDYTNSDPIGNVETGKNTINSNAGLNPNLMVMSREVFIKLRHHPQILERVKYSERGVLTIELLQAVFEIDKIVIAESLYNTAKKGQTASLSRVWGKHCILAFVTPRPGIKQVSLGYAFQARAFQTEKYRDDKIKSDVIRVSHIVDERVVSATCGYLIKNAVA